MPEYNFGVAERISAAVILLILSALSIVNGVVVVQQHGEPTELFAEAMVAMYIVLGLLTFALCFGRPFWANLSRAVEGIGEGIE